MVTVDAGEFVMGSERGYLEERPLRVAQLDTYRIDRYAVTNRDFCAFVSDTGHRTTAERTPERAPGRDMPARWFEPGSAVFVMTDGPVPLGDPGNWWRFVPGACWHAPEGPGSDVEERLDHPVVQVSLTDASAYAAWAGKSLPTEAQWEKAARAGSLTEYPWGDLFEPDERIMANTWQGAFPWRHGVFDEAPFTMPVDAFEPNDWGICNMIGNVWEWTTTVCPPGGSIAPCCSAPTGATGIHVLKGGSFLCAPSYCRRYRPAARSPLEGDNAASHVGFRCVDVV